MYCGYGSFYDWCWWLSSYSFWVRWLCCPIPQYHHNWCVDYLHGMASWFEFELFGQLVVWIKDIDVYLSLISHRICPYLVYSSIISLISSNYRYNFLETICISYDLVSSILTIESSSLAPCSMPLATNFTISTRSSQSMDLPQNYAVTD